MTDKSPITPALVRSFVSKAIEGHNIDILLKNAPDSHSMIKPSQMDVILDAVDKAFEQYEEKGLFALPDTKEIENV